MNMMCAQKNLQPTTRPGTEKNNGWVSLVFGLAAIYPFAYFMILVVLYSWPSLKPMYEPSQEAGLLIMIAVQLLFIVHVLASDMLARLTRRFASSAYSALLALLSRSTT
jgi:hypothetical protein